MASNPAGVCKVQVVVLFPGSAAETVEAARQTVQGLMRFLRRCRFFAHSPQLNASVALSAAIAAANPHHEPVLVREEQGLLGKNLQIWEWSGRPDQHTLYAVDGLRHGMVRAEGRVVLKAIKSLAKDAREMGKDLVLAVSHPWPIAAAVMLARRKLGEKKAPIVDWTASAAVLFTFRDNKLAEVAVYKPRDGGFVPFRVFRDSR